MAERLPVVFLSCGVFKNIIDSRLDDNENTRKKYLDPGLHATPKKLNLVVQAHIDNLKQPSIIILGYGLCGNGLNQIQAREHTLIIPKAEDCIAIIMGSQAKYLDQFRYNPGTYYLTKGWLEAGTHPLGEYESCVEKYDQETADYILDQQYRHYDKLVFIAHSQNDLNEFRPIAKKVAAFCERWDMTYEELLGSEVFIDQIESAIQSPEAILDSFIVIQPGETLVQEMFR